MNIVYVITRYYGKLNIERNSEAPSLHTRLKLLVLSSTSRIKSKKKKPFTPTNTYQAEFLNNLANSYTVRAFEKKLWQRNFGIHTIDVFLDNDVTYVDCKTMS